MGGGPSVAVFFTLLIAAITTFLYLDRQDQVKYDTLAKNAQRALVEKAVSDLRSPVPTGPSPSNLQEDAEPSPVTNTVTSAIETLCDKYPWNDLCKDRPGWTGIKPSDSDPPTPDIPETTPYMAMDVDGNSAVNFPEFFNATSPQIGGAISEDDLFQSFNIIDKNSDGFISEAEFAGTIGPSPIPTDTQPPTNIGPSPGTLSSATRSFCEEYPWNSLCKDRPGWTGIKPIYPSVENIEPSPAIIESPPMTTDPLPDISTTSMDMLCEQYPWNDLCKDRPGWTGIEPIYKVQDAIGPSPMSTGPSPTNVTSSIDSLCEKYPWNDLCRDRPGWTGVVPNEEFDTGDTTTTSKTSSEKGYEALSSGRYADALIEYTNALSIASDSEKPLLYNNRSIAYMRMGQFDSALRDANNIDATIDTNKLLRYTRTADALYGLERFTEAKNSYQLAVDMNPSSDNLILGLQRAERAEKLTTTTSEEAGTYTFTTDSTQGAYNSALAFTETSGTTQVTENSTERAEQSAVDVLCATTFWHEMCKDRPGWTGTPPDENIPTVDNTILDTICEPNTGTAPWLEICSYQEGWTGEKPIETSDSIQTDVISYTDYSSGLADISQLGGTGAIQETEEQLNDTKDQIPLSKWAYAYGNDTVGGTLFDTFRLSPDSETKANMETCLMKCNEQDYCKGVVFNDTFDRCWGRSGVTDTRKTPDRILYTKTDAADGILEPWNQELPTPPTVDVETEIPDVKSTKWTFEDGVDVTSTQTFHYTPETDPKATIENCIKECDNQSYCKAVVFNDDKTRCWGKLNTARRRSAWDRSLYTKTDDVNGISEPWNFCSNDENILHPMCKTQLDEKCATNITDPVCKGYKAYDTAVEAQLAEKCATSTTDPECADYPVYKKARLDAYCDTNTTDPECAGYTKYEAARDAEKLDAKCTANPTHQDCAGRPGYEEAVAEAIAKKNTFWKFKPDYEVRGGDTFHYHKNSDPKANLEVCLRKCNEQGDDCAGVVFDTNEELCWGKRNAINLIGGRTDRRFYQKTLDPSNMKQPWNFCSEKINLSDPYCEPQLDTYCLNEVEDDLCVGYIAYDLKKLLDEHCDTNTTDPECEGYPAYDAKKRLDEKCATNTIDPECAGYQAYDAKKQLDEKCATDTTDPECAGYPAYDAKRQLDKKCKTNTTDEECADYPMYKKARLDEKCMANPIDPECADRPGYAKAVVRANTFWKYRPNIDVSGFGVVDYFHYHVNTDPKASLEVCLNKCTDYGDDCGGVVFDTNEKWCWGRRKIHVDDNAITSQWKNRNLYEKTSNPNDINKPWIPTEEQIEANAMAEEAQGQLDIKCATNAIDEECASYPVYRKARLDEKCKTNTTDGECVGYEAYDNAEAIRQLDEKCKTNTTDPECADYPAYKKARLDEKCDTNTTDEECVGYEAYDKARLDEKCDTNTTDEECVGYEAYDKARLDEKCDTNTTDPECAGYALYDAAEAKRQLDTKCATNTTDEECADYVAYKAEMLCGSDDSIRDPLCFIKMCLKKDAPSICEQNPDRDRIRSTAKEIDDEILEELCKDSKDSNGRFKWNAPSACRSTGGRCSSAANGGKCHGNACCSTYNWCSGTTGGQRTAHCAYSDGEGGYRGKNDGKFDGTASRDEADKIARRPADFLDMVYQRVGDTSFCDIPANVLDPECADYDLAVSIADELDDEILTELCKDSTWSSGYFKSDTPSACRSTATEWNPDDYDNMQYRCGYGEYGNWYYNGRKWTRNLLKEFGNTKCPNDHCCSNLNWCNRWSTSGQARQDDWCFEPDGKGGYTGRANGKFDGDASRQEADKIARRPADFLDTVYQRVQERKAS